jgi:hypothetical protein
VLPLLLVLHLGCTGHPLPVACLEEIKTVLPYSESTNYEAEPRVTPSTQLTG